MSYRDWPSLEERVVSQTIAAAAVLNLLIVFFFYERGLKNLTISLKDVVDEKNAEDRDSKNFNTRRRALNLDKLEEIYDKILDTKIEGSSQSNNIFTTINIKDS